MRSGLPARWVTTRSSTPSSSWPGSQWRDALQSVSVPVAGIGDEHGAIATTRGADVRAREVLVAVEGRDADGARLALQLVSGDGIAVFQVREQRVRNEAAGAAVVERDADAVAGGLGDPVTISSHEGLPATGPLQGRAPSQRRA